MNAIADVNIETLFRTRPTYDPRLFVNRQEQMALINRRFEAWSKQGYIHYPIINFWGAGGIGKSWLLKHIQHEYSAVQKRSSITLFCEFLPRKESGPAEPALAYLVRTYAEALSKELKSLPAPLQLTDAAMLQRAQWEADVTQLVRALKEVMAASCLPIVLIDGTEHVSESEWRIIESEFIEKVAIFHRCIVLVAGRREIHTWYRFPVRSRMNERGEPAWFVGPLPPQDVRDQLRRLNLADQFANEAQLNWLFTVSAGDPHLIRVISEYSKVHRGQPPESAEFQSFLSGLLDVAIRDQIGDATETEQAYIQALLPLRLVTSISMEKMVREFAPETKPLPDYLEVLQELGLKTSVLWWDSARKDYVTNDITRHWLDEKLLLIDKALFRKRHEFAAKMYEAFAAETPQLSDREWIEAYYHWAQVYKFDSTQQARKLLTTKETALTKLKPDRRLSIKNEIEQGGDQEIVRLINNAAMY